MSDCPIDGESGCNCDCDQCVDYPEKAKPPTKRELSACIVSLKARIALLEARPVCYGWHYPYTVTWTAPNTTYTMLYLR